MRYQKDERIRNADQLLDEIRLFTEEPRLPSNLKSYSDVLRNLNTKIKQLFKRNYLLFLYTIESRLRSLLSQMREMERGTLQVSGDREVIESALCEFLSTLGRGDLYLDFSFPAFWVQTNLGFNGRFLTMNELATRRGVTINRVFLLCEEYINSPEVNRILSSHERIMAKVNLTSPKPFNIFYRIVPKENWNELRKEGWHRGILIKRGAAPKFIIPVYDTNHVVRTLRFISHGESRNRCIKLMEREISRSKAIEERGLELHFPGTDTGRY